MGAEASIPHKLFTSLTMMSDAPSTETADRVAPIAAIPQVQPPAPASDHNRRNFTFHLLNGVFIAISEAMTDINLIMTALLSQLTTSSVLIGLLAPLRDTGWFLPQLFISNQVERARHKIVFYRAATVFRVGGWVALTLSFLLIEDHTILLYAFIACMVVVSFSGGFGGISYMTVTAKVIPAKQRGLLFSLRELIGGGLSILMGGAGALILSGRINGLPALFPHNYGVLFGVSTLFFAIGSISFGLIVEPADVVPTRVTPMGQQLRRAWHVFKTDARFRHFMFTRTAILFARAGLPFIIVFAKRNMGVSDALVASLVSVTLGSALVASLALGRLNDRRGSGAVLVIASLLGIVQCACALLLLVMPSTALLIIAYVVGGVSTVGYNISLMPLLFDVIPASERPLYIGLTNSMLGVALVLTSLVGVIVVLAGFAVLFIFCAGCFALAFERITKLQRVVHA